MTDDLLALARDVDRLFRARQDGRQMPVGEACILLDRAGLYERRLPRWIADMAEWRPKVLDGLLDGLEFSVEPMPLIAADKSLFRTRRHVAMLALTEPDHFERCLAIVDGIHVCEDEDDNGKTFNICAWTDPKYGKVDRVCVISKPSDIARTTRPRGTCPGQSARLLGHHAQQPRRHARLHRRRPA